MASNVTCVNSTAADWDLQTVVDWLFTEGRYERSPIKLIERLCDCLLQVGAPVSRFRCNFFTLHPEVQGRSYTWWRGRGEVEEFRALHGIRQTEAYLGSPIEWISERREEVRVRLETAATTSLHGSLQELVTEGMTDYLGLPMCFNAGSTSSFLVCTDRKGGFDERDIDKYRKLAAYFTPVIEAIAMRIVARSLLDTYLGPRSGRRVFMGQVQRGDVEQLEAVIWFCDLRNFTALSEQLDDQSQLAMLNSYFEAVSEAVAAQGGEILRFVGDAMLVIFAQEEGKSRGDACRNAIESAVSAFGLMQLLNRTRTAQGLPGLSFGLGLHLGRVIYGNVGAPSRLDFTVLGAAVNRAARLESLTKALGVPLLMSAEVAEHLDRPVVNLGRQALRGVGEALEVYTLEGCEPGRPCQFHKP